MLRQLQLLRSRRRRVGAAPMLADPCSRNPEAVPGGGAGACEGYPSRGIVELVAWPAGQSKKRCLEKRLVQTAVIPTGIRMLCGFNQTSRGFHDPATPRARAHRGCRAARARRSGSRRSRPPARPPGHPRQRVCRPAWYAGLHTTRHAGHRVCRPATLPLEAPGVPFPPLSLPLPLRVSGGWLSATGAAECGVLVQAGRL